MNQNVLLFLNIKYYLWACTTSGKKLLILYVEQLMEKHGGPTPNKKSHWVKGVRG